MQELIHYNKFYEAHSRGWSMNDKNDQLPLAVITECGDIYDRFLNCFRLRAEYESTCGYIEGTPYQDPKEVDEMDRVELFDEESDDGETKVYYYRLKLRGSPTDEEINFHVKEEFPAHGRDYDFSPSGQWFSYDGVVDGIKRNSEVTIVWVRKTHALDC